MQRIVLIAALLVSLSSAARAQTYDPTPMQKYFVGTTEELFRIRAAIRTIWCDAHPAASGSPVCQPAQISAPWSYDDPYYLSDGPVIREDVGINCMGATPSATGPELGQSAYVDVDPTSGVDMVMVDVPAIEDLLPTLSLPQPCIDQLVEISCGTWWLPIIEMCSWEFMYCCPLIDCGTIEPEYVEYVCDRYATCCP